MYLRRSFSVGCRNISFHSVSFMFTAKNININVVFSMLLLSCVRSDACALTHALSHVRLCVLTCAFYCVLIYIYIYTAFS